MKPIHALILFMTGLLVLINSPLSAQEKPAAPANPPSPPPAEKSDEPSADRKSRPPRPEPNARPQGDQRRPDGEGESRRDHARAAAPKPQEVPTAFIGVLTTNVSPELQAQFSLPEGFGLQIVEVMPDSPAKEAGLKEHDILVNLDDQKLVSMDQLQTLVRSKKKDEQITFTIISGGKQSQVQVKVGERMMPERMDENRRMMNRFFQPGNFGSQHPQFGVPSQQLQENLERFQSRLREYQERLQQWTRDGHRGPMPTPPVLEDGNQFKGDHHPDRRGGDRGSSFSSSGSSSSSDQHRSAGVTRRDESGSYSLHRTDDYSVFSVRPNGGGEQVFSFSNEAQRNLIPEQFRDKLRQLEEISEDMHRGGPREPNVRPGEGDRRPEGNRRPDGDHRPGDANPPRPAPEARPGNQPAPQSPPPSRSRDTF